MWRAASPISEAQPSLRISWRRSVKETVKRHPYETGGIQRRMFRGDFCGLKCLMPLINHEAQDHKCDSNEKGDGGLMSSYYVKPYVKAAEASRSMRKEGRDVADDALHSGQERAADNTK